MTLESFFNHPLLIWEWMAWIVSAAIVKTIIKFIWRKGKKHGRKEYDDYKKWEERFKKEGKLKDD